MARYMKEAEFHRIQRLRKEGYTASAISKLTGRGTVTIGKVFRAGTWKRYPSRDSLEANHRVEAIPGMLITPSPASSVIQVQENNTIADLRAAKAKINAQFDAVIAAMLKEA